VRLTIPTLITLFRILMIPVMVLLFYSEHRLSNIFATAVFVAGALTDWLDGWIARRYEMYSAFGAFLDPVADKLAVTVALFLVVQYHHTVLIALLAAVIVSREITISALREWMASLGKSKSVAVNILGKVKTVGQLVAIPFLLFNGVLFGLFHTVPVGRLLIWIAAFITLWSMLVYLKAAWATERGPH
jgi:CDP-diacylglycerol---glycerol-3-phosphate 3-phosphatidyltransferase